LTTTGLGPPSMLASYFLVEGCHSSVAVQPLSLYSIYANDLTICWTARRSATEMHHSGGAFADTPASEDVHPRKNTPVNVFKNSGQVSLTQFTVEVYRERPTARRSLKVSNTSQVSNMPWTYRNWIIRLTFYWAHSKWDGFNPSQRLRDSKLLRR